MRRRLALAARAGVVLVGRVLAGQYHQQSRQVLPWRKPESAPDHLMTGTESDLEMNGRDNLAAEEGNLSIIRRYYNGCTAGDLDRLRSTLHLDVVHYFLAPNPGSKPVGGREHLARYWRKVTRAIDARWVVDQAVTMGDQTVIEWTMFWRPAPGAARIATRGAEWFVFRDGLIFEIRSYHQQRDGFTELDGFDYSGRGYSTPDSEKSLVHPDATRFAAPKQPEDKPS